jgi:hypothetical protein
MVENFGGILNLIVFIALTLGWAMYAYQMSFGIEAFYGKFNISRTGTIIGGFVSAFAASAVIMHIILLINGLEGAWYLFTYFIVQAAIAALLSWRTVSAKVAADEGVIYTMEPIIAPIIFGVAYCFLLFRMQNLLYT